MTEEEIRRIKAGAERAGEEHLRNVLAEAKRIREEKRKSHGPLRRLLDRLMDYLIG